MKTADPTMAQTAAQTDVPEVLGFAGAAKRLVSLDAFRGATMALMVLVNNPGDGRYVYAPLEHAEWNGWTPTDVVFPSFLWAVGLSLTLSVGKRLAAGTSRGRLFWQAFRRAVILYALGLLVYAYPGFNLSTQRAMGVLQRIAICYLIGVSIYLTTRLRGQVIWIVSLLAGYWLIMTWVPVPGFGSGRLDAEGNVAHYVDRIVLGTHNYRWTQTWDPEGVVSTLPAIATVLLGIMAGHILRLRKTFGERTAWLLIAGSLLLAAGLICNTWLPINKKLWTSSFALFMAGLDFALFAILFWIADGLGHTRWTKPLVILGMNAIAVYLLSEFLDEALGAVHWVVDGRVTTLHGWLYANVFAVLASPLNASLLYAMAYTLLMYLFAYALYRRGWFIRV